MTKQVQKHQKSPPPKWKYIMIVVLIIIFILVGAVIWVLNILGIVKGPWSSILGVIFTALGLILAIFQWHAQVSNPQSSLLEPSSFDKEKLNESLTESKPLTEELVSQIMGDKGILLVYTARNLRGATLNLGRGFDTLQLKACIATNVVEKKIGRQSGCVGIFPSLEPGNYVVYTDSRQFVSKVTVPAGCTTEIDWRFVDHAYLKR